VAGGAAVFAVCAGMQILGHTFPDSTGARRDGLGLLDAETIRVDRPRAVGELPSDPIRAGRCPTSPGSRTMAVARAVARLRSASVRSSSARATASATRGS
jgi:CobQ-like glutamine amidotransferase family enzyme